MTSRRLRNSLPHGKRANGTCAAMIDALQLSDYFFSLEAEIKKRYKQKISLFEGQDPYALKKKDFEREDVVGFPDFRYSP